MNSLYDKPKQHCLHNQHINCLHSYSTLVMTSALWISSWCIYGPQRRKTYLLICSPNEDSNQPAHPRIWLESSLSVWRNFASLAIQHTPMKILIRLHKCAGWAESSLSAYIRRYTFSNVAAYIAQINITTRKLWDTWRVWRTSSTAKRTVHDHTYSSQIFYSSPYVIR